ncbi:hypothetical protein MOTT27_03146 [Mycobacterium intracellulare subsp. yongonense]|nr:hypothetical protein MOTT27_03146 [Mycobacterium intracellulare subsp. yongonense]ETZ28430.1 hypothetical protein L842_3453 [Mycobacterium intracellulare MIN_052511_1280]
MAQADQGRGDADQDPVHQGRNDQCHRVFGEGVPGPAERVTDAEGRRGRAAVPGRGAVAGRRPVARGRRAISGGRAVTRGWRGRRAVTGRWRVAGGILAPALRVRRAWIFGGLAHVRPCCPGRNAR